MERLVTMQQLGFVLTVTLAMALPVAAEPGVCEVAGSDHGVVQGRLGLLQGLGPSAFIVAVPGGMCLSGPQPTDNVDRVLTVQLYSQTAEGFQELYRLVGQKVYVRGKLSAGGTFQQKAPVIMEVIEIATN